MKLSIMHESFAEVIFAKHPNARVSGGYVVSGYIPPDFDSVTVDLSGQFLTEDGELITESLTATVDAMLAANPTGQLVLVSESQANYLDNNHPVFMRSEADEEAI